MKLQTVLVLAAMLNAGGVSAAETSTPETAPAQATAPEAGAANLTPAQQARRDKVKGERQSCRAKAQGQGLKGEAIRASVQECMAQVDPMAAKRMKCVQAGKAQNLTGDEMKKSVRQCMQGA